VNQGDSSVEFNSLRTMHFAEVKPSSFTNGADSSHFVLTGGAVHGAAPDPIATQTPPQQTGIVLPQLVDLLPPHPQEAEDGHALAVANDWSNTGR